MALVIETGAGVEGATSYVSLVDARTYAANRGLTLHHQDDKAEAQLVRAFDFVNSLEPRFGGRRTYPENAFPRTDLCVNGFTVDPAQVPMQAIYAQVQVALAIETGVDPQPIIDFSAQIVKEKVGQLETEYAVPASMWSATPQITAAMYLLRQLFKGSGSDQLMLWRA